MSDYVNTLRKKAREFISDRATITARIKTDNESLTKINAALSGIEALLRMEGATLDSDLAVLSSFMINAGAMTPKLDGPPPPLKVFLKDTLDDGQERDLSELIDAAKNRGITFGAKDPWKAVNMTLMGLQSGKTVKRTEGNRWRKGP